ncbi:MAG: hypothetical protein M1436_08010, partial [Acidobacteria bacterium]|nr:hypothetical protein [Acidobacteriota bacterium]
FVFGRVLSTGGLSGYPGYRPVLSLGVYLASAFHYLRSAFYEPRWLTPVAGWLIAILLVAAALRWRSVPLRLGVAWVFIGILPVAFIPQRSLDAVSIPMLGLALCVSLGIAAAASRLRAPAPLVFGGTLVALVLFHAPHRAVYLRNEYREIWSAYQELLGYQRVHPFRAGSRILFLRDPFGDKVWGTTYLVYLASKDHSLTVNRVDHPEREPDPNQPLRFERVLSFADERLLECDAGPFQDLSARELAARAATAVCLEKP